MITAEDREMFRMEDGRRGARGPKTEFTEHVQFKLREDQLDALRRRRDTTKVPMAVMLRDAVDAYLRSTGV